MRTRNEDISGGSHAMKPKTENQAKKPYRSPRLMVYGDLSRLTTAKGGKDNDKGPGNPDTFVK